MSNETTGNLWALKYNEHMAKSKELLEKAKNPEYTCNQGLAIVDLAGVELKIALFCKEQANAHYEL